MATNRKINERREKVAKYTLKGFAASHIAKTLNVSESTIERDRKKHRQNWADNFKKESLEKAIYHFMMTHDEAFKIAWRVLEDTSDERIKLQCINTINRCLETKVKLLQSMGVIEQTPEKIELSGRISVQKIREISREVKKEKEESHEKASV